MICRSKIKAGAIQYVLVLSVIIIILLFAFISLVFLQKKSLQKSNLHKTAIQSVYQSFDRIGRQDIPYGQETTFQLSDMAFEKTRIFKKHWGVFDVAISRSTLKNETFQKVALLGHLNSNRKALYLKENNQPLALVGHTKITGDVVLPSRGVKTGNIAGTSYYGEQLIDGGIQVSTTRLPDIRKLPYLQALTNGRAFEDVAYFSMEDNIDIRQPFTDKTKVFETGRELVLAHMKLYGNIVLVSQQKIRVLPSAILEDVILIAPEIIIESNAKITCQLFATDRILIRGGAELLYPSSASMIREKGVKKKEEPTQIIIEKNVVFRGVLLYHSEAEEAPFKPQIRIDEGALVIGEVYCNKNLELGGSVKGFVNVGNFIAVLFGGVYLNHIYNGEIDAPGISEHYAGLALNSPNLKVAKWID